MQRFALILLCAGVVVTGCSEPSVVGTYLGEVRLIEGKTEAASKKFPLADVQAVFKKHGDQTLTLKSKGKYTRVENGRSNYGEWWIEDGDVSIRCLGQNGKRMPKSLVSLDADIIFKIRDGMLVQGRWKDDNLEVVYVLKSPSE